MPVTSIGDSAFSGCTSLTSITIPNGVTNIGWRAFSDCTSMTSIAVDSANPNYGSFDGVLFNKDQTVLIQCPGGKAGSYSIPNSVASIGDSAFYGCTSLRGTYFQGNAPSLDWDAFYGADNVTVYYLSGTTGWKSTFGERSTALWTNPLLAAGSVRADGNGFAFSISWAPNAALVVEACSDLASPSWSPISTNTPTSGSWDFRDPDWRTHLNRFYRVRSP